jgi:aminopeptidase N
VVFVFKIKLFTQVDAPSEIDEIFDAISYCKGATTIRMLHDYIGDEVRL